MTSPTPEGQRVAGTCDQCMHWSPSLNHWPTGECCSDEWLLGYNVNIGAIKPASVIVENDEGWGFMTGPKFGCVHFAPTTSGREVE